MLTYFVVAPILLAVFMYLYTNETLAKIGAILVQASLFIASLYMFLEARETPIELAVGGYETVLGIALRASAFNAALIVLTTLVFLMITIYNYPEEKTKMFWLLMFIWEGALIGIFLTGDFFNRFVLMEVATIISTILIMYDREKRSMYHGLYYLVINVVSVQFYLFGVGYLYRMTGTMDMQLATYRLQDIPAEQLLLPYALIMTFAAMKCALLPMGNWVSKALATEGSPPTVNAVMSAVHMVSGLYLFMSMHNVFPNMQQNYLFIIMGALTSMVGVLFGLAQRNVKKLLSYVSIVQFGLVVIALNIGDYYSTVGAMFHILNYALFSAILFLGMGIVIRKYQTNHLNQIRGVFKTTPVTAVALVCAMFGIVGTPFFSGSVSTYFMLRGADQWVAVLIATVGALNLALFARFSTIFFGQANTETINRDLYARRFQSVPLLPLALICLLGGIFGEQVMGFLLNTGAYTSPYSNTQKLTMFAISLAVGYSLHHVTRAKSADGEPAGFLYKVKYYDMGFRGIVISVGLFFGLILLVSII